MLKLQYMEQLKHECGVALIRLRKPLHYYKEKYGRWTWALDKLYLLMEKQHNRGQEAAGLGVVKIEADAGHEYIFRERAEGADAIPEIFGKVRRSIGNLEGYADDRDIELHAPFIGQIYMGHLRYSTTGRSGLSYVHPFLRRNNWRSRNLLLCGNFNMTNVDELFANIVSRGQHPRIYSDTIMLLEQLGYALDSENHRMYRELRHKLQDPELNHQIERSIDLTRVMADTATGWDGGYVICGATGAGHSFVLRDPSGIRPAFYYIDDEVVVLASERPVIQTTFGTRAEEVHELQPGQGLVVDLDGNVSLPQVLQARTEQKCSFERIYFSRGSDKDIYRERKQLGRSLVPKLVDMLDGDLDNTVFSFIPNTAEVAYMGMVDGLEEWMDQHKMDEILDLKAKNKLTREALQRIMLRKVRTEKAAIKDIKLRTFIAEGESRNELAKHVYDITYGCVRPHTDTLVVIDDSIVRGTTLERSILRMLDRLQPRRIIVVSSSPQVRYPDYYGIDMSRMAEFIAFQAAVALLRESGREQVLDDVYHRCLEQLQLPAAEQVNCVQAVYEPFTDDEISAKIAQLVTSPKVNARVDILYQTLDGLHQAVPHHSGDWYFSGNYPTPGGIRLVNQAYVNYYEGRTQAR